MPRAGHPGVGWPVDWFLTRVFGGRRVLRVFAVWLGFRRFAWLQKEFGIWTLRECGFMDRASLEETPSGIAWPVL